MTPQAFIETAALYTRIGIPSFTPPGSITRMCTNVKCKRETTWAKTDYIHARTERATPEIDVHCVAYTCGLCGANSLGVIYELLEWSGSGAYYSHKAVRKIGQVPAPDVAIPDELGSRLGASASYYKNALICRQNNYGIGAVAYLRRVVDIHTDDLIDVMIGLSRTYSVSEEKIGELVAAKSEVQYKEKLKVASELVPEALKPGGVNPLGQLYKHTSIGLHLKTDDECVQIFDDLRADFEYVFKHLHLQADERRKFAERVQKRAGQNQG